MTDSIKRLIGLAAAGLFMACSPQTTSVRPAYASAEPVLPELQVPLPEAVLSYELPQPEIKTYTFPTVRISEHFTPMERNHVRARDNNLFAKNSEWLIDLAAEADRAFAFPLPGGKVISPYAGRRKNHSGVDIKTRANDTIVAAFDGIVRMSKPYAAYGNVVVVRHYNGLETVYSHNSKNLVKPGDRVKAGMPLALTGRTGRATTEHLHFEIRIDGQHFDPATIIDFENRTLRKRQWVVSQNPNGKVTITPAGIADPADPVA